MIGWQYKGVKKDYIWYISVIVIVFLCGYLSSEWFQLMLIQGDSMLPSYHNMQLVVQDKHNRDYHVGDVIAFRCEGLSAVLVKRIAACKGDKVQIVDSTLYVNGEVSSLYEEGSFDYAGILEEEVKLSTDEYVVIGDNVAESKDSRYPEIGIVQEETMIGRIIHKDTGAERWNRPFSSECPP